jgi:hypothetical protein
MRTLDAELVGERTDLRLGWDVRPSGVGRFPRFSWQWPVITALDNRLVGGLSRAVECPEPARLLAAATDLSVVVVANEVALHVSSPDGARTVPFGRADSVTLLSGGRALVTGRLDDNRHRVGLIAIWDGAVLDQVYLDTYMAEVSALPHPHDGTVLLEAGEGQDGSRVFLARVTNARLAVEAVFRDVVVADFSRSGRRLLLVPHPNFDNVVSVLDWPDRRITATLDSAAVGLDIFDFYGCFSRDDAVLIKTVEDGLLLASSTLDDVARIRLAGLDSTEDDEVGLGMVIGLGDDAIGVDVWRNGQEHAMVWRLPDEPGLV